MLLWTIRHSRPYNPKDVCYGRLDFDVSPTFPQESDGAIKAFLSAGPKPTKLYSSPLLRCMRLAEKVSQAINLPIEKVDAIQEINFGTWEGQKLTAVPRDEMHAWMKDLRGFRFPGGENFYDIDKRAGDFLDTLPDDGEFLWKAANNNPDIYWPYAIDIEKDQVNVWYETPAAASDMHDVISYSKEGALLSTQRRIREAEKETL